MRIKAIFTLTFILSLNCLFSQVGIGTTTPNGALEIKSSTNGVLVSNVVLTSRNIEAPVVNPNGGAILVGTLVWNTSTAGNSPNNVTPGFYYWDGSLWVAIAGDGGKNWTTTGNAGTTAGTNYIGTTDAIDFVTRTNSIEKMRVTSAGNVGINTPTPTATALLTINPNTNAIRSGIDMTMTNAASTAFAINVAAANANSRGYFYDNTSIANGVFFGAGALLSTTNIVSGFLGYRNGSGLSYGIYGINGTNAAYGTNSNTWAAFLQGRTVISSESTPTSLLGTDLEVRNTTTGAAAPATISIRQTTAQVTNGNVLANLNFGDNYATTPQAQIQVSRDATASSSADIPTAMTFSTIADATATLSERMRITNAGNVGIGASPNASAMLDINASNRGLLIPNVALTARNTVGPITAPATSLLVYNTATAGVSPNNIFPGYYYWNGSAWIAFTGSGGNDWSINGNSGTGAANYVGTSDAVSLKIATNGVERMRVLTTTGQVVVNNTGAPFGSDRFSVYNTSATDYAINGYSSSTGVGVYGENTGGGTGVQGFNNSIGTGVRGINTSTGAGVFGSTAGSTSAGVFGVANVANGAAVYGTTNGNSGTGIFGNTSGTSGIGVYGQSSGTSGTGVWGYANNTLADGVYGEATQAGRYGVWGVNNNATGIGVRGSSTGTSGFGVYGIQTQASRPGVFGLNDNAIGFGIYGTSAGISGIGVYGTSAGATGFGVYGTNSNVTGTGIFGITNSTTGANFGVRGQSASNTGFGILATNTNTSGTGLLVSGNNTTQNYLGTGSGASINGTNIGTLSFGTSSASGNGVIGIGNNLTSSIFVPSTGAGTVGIGNQFGVIGFATTTINTNGANTSITNGANASAGGYFEVLNGGSAQTWSYVGVRDDTGVNRKIIGNGTVNTIVKNLEGKLVALSCPEAPENLFQDYGNGKLINGKAHITLDPILSKNIAVNDKHPLRVFIQLEGDCKGVYVSNKTQYGFDVTELKNGNSNVSFTYSIVANRADEINPDGTLAKYSEERFSPAPGPIVKTKTESEKLATNLEIQNKTEIKAIANEQPIKEVKIITSDKSIKEDKIKTSEDLH